MGTLKIISYNVKGLHSPVKTKKILYQLKRANCQIAFLQETHLPDLEHVKLKLKNGQIKCITLHINQGGKKAVAILIHRQVNFTQTSTYKDKEGRYILVNGFIDDIEVSVINVYACNKDEPSFI